MKQSPVFDLYVVEWSENQQHFHIHTVSEMLKKNLASYYHRGDSAESDWIVVGIVATHEEAHSWIQRLKDGMDRPMPDVASE